MKGKAKAVARPRRKVDRRQASVEAILDAAKHLFVTRGYHGTRIDEIANRVGLTKGAVYFHFKDKEAVLKALLERVRNVVLEPLIRNVENGAGRPADRLIAFLHHEARVASQDPAMLLLPITISIEFDGRGDQIDKYVKGGYRRIERMLECVLQEGVESGEFRDDISPREHANILVALNDGMMLAWLRCGQRLDGAVLMRAMRATLWHGISAPGQVRQSDKRNADRSYLKLAMIRR